MLLAREALFLRGRDDAAVLDQARGRVVVVGGDAEDADGQLEQRVDERRDGARLREHDQQAEQHEHDDDRHQPVLLFLPQELPELASTRLLAM